MIRVLPGQIGFQVIVFLHTTRLKLIPDIKKIVDTEVCIHQLKNIMLHVNMPCGFL